MTYQFGSESYDFRLPMGTVRNATYDRNATYVGYDVVSETGETVAPAETAGFVFSNAAVQANEYLVQKGKAREFTLVTLVKLLEDVVAAGQYSSLSLQVTALPFDIISDGKVYQNRLNEPELRTYVTPAVTF